MCSKIYVSDVSLHDEISIGSKGKRFVSLACKGKPVLISIFAFK